jgi:hypothetical protein
MHHGTTLYLNPGSDWLLRAPVLDEGGPVDLTGCTAAVADVGGVLGTAPAFAIVDPAAGLVEFSGIWQASWPLAGGWLGDLRLTLTRGQMHVASFLGAVAVNARVNRLVVARGADLSAEIDWPDDRLGRDLTDDVIEVVNAAPALAGRITVEVVDPVARKLRWHLEGSPALPLGNLGTFQLQRSTGGVHRRTRLPTRIICK